MREYRFVSKTGKTTPWKILSKEGVTSACVKAKKELGDHFDLQVREVSESLPEVQE